MKRGDRVKLAEKWDGVVEESNIPPYTWHAGKTATIVREHDLPPSSDGYPVWRIAVDDTYVDEDGTNDYVSEKFMTLLPESRTDEFVRAYEYMETMVNAMRAVKFVNYVDQHHRERTVSDPIFAQKLVDDILLISRGKHAIYLGIHPTEWDV